MINQRWFILSIIVCLSINKIICHCCPRTSGKDEDAAGLGEVTEKIHELLLVSQNLPDVTAAIRQLTDLAATQKVILSAPQLQTIKQGLSCAVCKSKYAKVLYRNWITCHWHVPDFGSLYILWEIYDITSCKLLVTANGAIIHYIVF